MLTLESSGWLQETKWEHIQKNALLVEVNEDLTESEAAYDYHSVQTHSSDEVASPDTQVNRIFAPSTFNFEDNSNYLTDCLPQCGKAH